ncbi:lysis protein [Xenorhabdus sp. Vera]|uniref:lysis protein n=1 Tax=Xenorhabdus koppenhoeferi TaxID=351659 RepID=UPI0019B553E8|nr:lysis protein [Xenorhabdus sp. Vera]MBD2812348.1 lysis protein [Xenorhabdus sp. Vera]
MKLNVTKGTVIALVIASASAFLYRSGYKKQLGINNDQITEIQQLTDTINYQNTHIEMLHELDSKHTQELAHAKTEIDTLRADVAAGRRKLRIQATCPVRETTASSSVGNAGTPQFTETARQDYYRLREVMAANARQTKYLQDYINTECIRKE